MPTAKAKKPRQRSRPKNKSNRLQDINNNNDIVDGKDVTIDCNNNIVEAAASETPSEVKNERSAGNANEETIKLIQQLLRQKILKQTRQKQQQQQQQQQQQDNSTNNNNNVSKNDNKDKEKVCSKPAASVQTSQQQQPLLQQQQQPQRADKEQSSQSVVKKSKSKDKVSEQNAFIQNLQKKMENTLTNDGEKMPSALLENLQKLFLQEPVSDIESSDDEEEYIEYIYKPRQYFIYSLCNLCKTNLCGKVLLPCKRCGLTYYCSMAHMKDDQQHRQLCYALQQVADSCGNDIFYKCGDFSIEQFRSYRIVNIRKAESVMNRSLTATEQEVLLFPRICNEPKCREHRYARLEDCGKCGQVAYCKDKPEHLSREHRLWCQSYRLFKELIMFQERFGRLDPSLPSKVLTELPVTCSNTKQILNKLDFNMQDPCEYAALSQVSTGPLTAWYALKLCDKLKHNDTLVVHLIGAEIEFEVDVLHKWELFFLHITPTLKQLHVVFVGPELNPRNISFEQLKKTKCCRECRKAERTVNYHFENQIYHDYCKTTAFIKPDLICFFNAGLYRSTGFQMEDTWPETILAAANLKCPVVVTAYTAYETPLDMTRFVQESNRRLNVVMPPTKNPFASDKPERNFISDVEAPLMFKNYYSFVVE